MKEKPKSYGPFFHGPIELTTDKKAIREEMKKDRERRTVRIRPSKLP